MELLNIFRKKRFVDWYAKQVIPEIERGVNTEDISVDLKLLTPCPEFPKYNKPVPN